ncbi:hypothetical protein BCR34DRAFT_600592 [Clohesyomyces aquaticus]|uniref:Uncharacterized protein n=1 Tax=Clohesyomyces aquaticus TaxID=1231657 RepID=A0A1Y1ZQL6_9PLEO|nr:hypothetical protein BCR34DRAFT_600592 [Clohesyomyces aquaticus]
MPANSSTATGSLSVMGRTPTLPPAHTSTFSTLFRKVTGKQEKTHKVKTKEGFIPKYELEWDKLKNWLDERFPVADYGCTFTERFNVQGDMYVVSLPEDLSEEDKVAIAKLKSPRSTT